MWASLTWEMLSFAALGSFALWMRLKYGTNLLRDVEELVNEICDDFRLRVLVQIAIFVIFGAVVSVIMVEPRTEKQALAAGMACSVLLGNMATAGAKRGKPSGGST